MTSPAIKEKTVLLYNIMTTTLLQKWQIVIFTIAGWKIDEIARYINVNRKTVMRWKQRYNYTEKLERKVGSGRKISIIDDIHKVIGELVTNNRMISIREIRIIINEQHSDISLASIQKIIHELNFEWTLQTPKPLLTSKHISDRLEWAYNHKNFKWGDCIFSDEATIWMEDYSGKIWMKEGEECLFQKVKHPYKIHIWAAISRYGKTEIHIFTGNMNSKKYISILESDLVSFYNEIKKRNRRVIYQHDNDSKHRSHATKDFMKLNKIKVLDWPSCSPDLNLIENVWSVMKLNIEKRLPRTKEELIEYIKIEWNNISQNFIDKLYKSMNKRITEVINRSGKSIDY